MIYLKRSNIVISVLVLCILVSILYKSRNVGKYFSGKSIFVESFGAKGDGLTDDSKAINEAYDFARAHKGSVHYDKKTYLLKSSVNATGVSSFGNKTKLVFELSPKSGYAFKWGGDGCEVNGFWFDLYNISGKDKVIQGIINNINNVSNQKFANNKIITNTYTTDNRANIYGLWVTGMGLDKLYIYNNEIYNSKYGIQINNQSADDIDVDNKQIGKPSKDIIIQDNILDDATIGINTPHLFCSNVVISRNKVKSKYGLEINIAHVTDYKIIDNNCEGKINSIDSNIHIEDASYNGLISGNELKPSYIQDGIRYIVKPGISGDSKKIDDYSKIINNSIIGRGINSKTSAIMVGDVYGNRLTVKGNQINSVNKGLVLCGKFIKATDNTVNNTYLAVTVLENTTAVSNNIFTNCTNIINTAKDALIENCKFISCGNFYPIDDEKKNKTVVYRNSSITISNVSISSDKPYDLLMVPQRKIDLDIVINIQSYLSNITSNYKIKLDDKKDTITKECEEVKGSLETINIKKENNMLKAYNYFSESKRKAEITITIENLTMY